MSNSKLTDPMTASVEAYIGKMSLAEKLGQLFLVYFEGPDLSEPLREMIQNYHIGGMILYAIAGNTESLTQIRQLTTSVQREAMQCGARIPLWIGIDQEGGSVVRLPQGSTHFPSQMAVGATGSLALAHAMARATARELQQLGINMNFAPVIDVNSNPANPIIGIRAFSSDPEQVAQFGLATVQAYQAAGVIPTPKHFPGHGDTAIDSHLGLPTVDRSREELEAVDWLPFRAAIAGGAEVIMTAHVVLSGLAAEGGWEMGSQHPATLSAEVLQGILREDLGFEGVIMTDSLTMGAIDQLFGIPEAAEMALQAGADMLLFGADRGHSPAEQKLVYQYLWDHVLAGQITVNRLDESVRRILRVKANYGLLEGISDQITENYEDPQPPLVFSFPDHQDLALQIAQQSVTVMRDRANQLPLQPHEPILVIWPCSSRDPGPILRTHFPHLQIISMDLDPSPDQIEQIQGLAQQVDRVIVGSLQIQRYPQQLKLIQSLPIEALIVVGLGAPEDLMDVAEISCLIATYGDAPASLTALAQTLVDH